nr:uncharacterized protein LOC128684075 [Cherax quadricarinatus]
MTPNHHLTCHNLTGDARSTLIKEASLIHCNKIDDLRSRETENWRLFWLKVLERKLSIMGEESEDDYDDSASLPPVKRIRVTQMDLMNHLLSEVSEIKTCMNTRLTSLETKVSVLVQTCNRMSSKLDAIERLVGKQPDQNAPMEMAFGDLIPLSDSCLNSFQQVPQIGHTSSVRKDPAVTEDISFDFDSLQNSNLDLSDVKVFKGVIPKLTYLAICLILFEKYFILNKVFSSAGRWNKRQLDPLMIFGIRCHLQYKFNISSKIWHKICQNMDSKCRSAWKRRIRGMVTQPRNSRQVPQIGHTSSVRKDPAVTEDISFDFDSLQNSNLDLSDVKVITQSPTCELRILSATPEQISHLQDTQEIILSEEQILAQSSNEKSILISNSSSVSMGTEVMSGEELGEELDMPHDPPHSPLSAQTSTLAVMDDSHHRITLKTEPELEILDQHGILARDSETDD